MKRRDVNVRAFDALTSKRRCEGRNQATRTVSFKKRSFSFLGITLVAQGKRTPEQPALDDPMNGDV